MTTEIKFFKPQPLEVEARLLDIKGLSIFESGLRVARELKIPSTTARAYIQASRMGAKCWGELSRYYRERQKKQTDDSFHEWVKKRDAQNKIEREEELRKQQAELRKQEEMRHKQTKRMDMIKFTLDHTCQHLDDQEARTIEGIYLQGRSLEEMRSELGGSVSRISKMKYRALGKIRGIAKKEKIDCPI